MTAAAAKGSGLSPTRSTLAALVTACDPVLAWQSRSVMTETPTAFFLAAALAALTCRGWLGPVLGGLCTRSGCALPAQHARGAVLAVVAAAFWLNLVNHGVD